MQPSPSQADTGPQQPRKRHLFCSSGAADFIHAVSVDRRFWPVIADRRAANDGQPPTDDALRNLLVRRGLAQSPRRFSGDPITGFGALA